LSTAGTEAMFADLGYFTAGSIRVCNMIDCRIGFCFPCLTFLGDIVEAMRKNLWPFMHFSAKWIILLRAFEA
jgi:K+ transporter